MAWAKWTALVGGVIAVLGQFVPGYYLALVGGVVAVIGALGSQ
jgi:hypothetical protein